MSGTAEDLEARDLTPTVVEGYKVSAKKTIRELSQLDAEDESLKKWKESLGLNTQQYYSPPDDSRAIVVLHLAMETEGRPDVVMKLDTKEDIEALKKTSMVIKEGTIFCLKATFRVQHDVVCGLKYIHVVKRKGIRVDKMEEMLGSYGPSETPYVKKFSSGEAPSGSIITRGRYDVRSRFIDDDKNTHLDWNWSFEIRKNWD